MVFRLTFTSTMLSRIICTFLALAAYAVAAITYKGYDLSSLSMMEDDEGATFYTGSGTKSTAESILGGNSARLRQDRVHFLHI